MKRAVLILLVLLLAGLARGESYERPDQEIVKAFEAYPADYISFQQSGKAAVAYRIDPYPSLKDMMEPTVALAGERISKRLFGERDLTPIIAYSFFFPGDKTTVTPRFPREGPVSSVRLDAAGEWAVVSVQGEEGVLLELAETSTGRVYPLKGLRANIAFGDDAVKWTGGGYLLVRAVSLPGKNPPQEPDVPQGPVIRETSGERSLVRTYQNLLQNTYDESLFEYYFRSELVLVDPETRRMRKTGVSGLIDDASLSPDGRYLYYSEIVRPYSYHVPWYYFPKRCVVRDLRKGDERILHERPLQESLPVGGTFTGPRSFDWQPTAPHSLVWVEALDDGDPGKDVPFRDRVMRLDHPLEGEARPVVETVERYSGISWSPDPGEFIIFDYSREKLWYTARFINSVSGTETTVIDRSIRDIYHSNGDLVTRRIVGGTVFVKKEGKIFFINDKGATPEGNRPFMASVDLATGERHILYRSREGYHETPLGFLGEGTDSILLASESPGQVRNYYLYQRHNESLTPLTDYPDPYQGVLDVRKEAVRYTREDGIPLSGTLYLPGGYDGKEPLPLFIWAYPEEYRDPSTAGQADLSPNRFTRIWGDSPIFLAMAGFAVLYDASIPIVGDAQTVNDTFIEQTVGSVQAAVDYLAGRGIADPRRVAIGGHSYGAFMTANVLAHSDICQAGIARSGAYNRTLTPFGFQSEERTLWEATDFYIKVSPFMSADRIKEPLLLIHGELDPNSGTYPLQSERMFDAIKGNGGTARFVLLPGERHGYYARESQLHVLAEMIHWLKSHL